MGQQLKAWKTNPSSRARKAARPSSSRLNRSWPRRRTVPPEGVSRPASKASSVLLPEPEAPTMATDSCARLEAQRMQNRQLAGGVLHALGELIDFDEDFGHGVARVAGDETTGAGAL